MSGENFSLPIRPFPKAGESIIGYLLRLTHANGYRGLASLIKMRRRYFPGAGNIFTYLEILTLHSQEKLKCLCGPVPIQLSQSQDSLLGVQVLHWNKTYRRWCPQCLKKYGYWRAEWMLTLQTICVEHNNTLIDICPSCNCHIFWYRGGLYTCPCGGDLRSAISDPSSPNQLDLALQVHKGFELLINQPASTTENLLQAKLHILSEVQLPRLFQLIWLIGAFSINNKVSKPQKLENAQHLATASKLCNAALSILEDWPTQFHEFLAIYCKQQIKQGLSLRKFVGPLYQNLCHLFKHPELHFIKHEFEQFLKINWPSTLTKRNRLILNIIDDHPVIGVIEATRILKVSKEKIFVLVENGSIHGWYTLLPSGRRMLLVDKASVQSFQMVSNGLMTLRDVASRYKTSKRRVIALAEAGFLNPVASPRYGDQHQHWMFFRSEVERFLMKLTAIQPATSSSAVSRSFANSIRYMGDGTDNLVALVHAILDGHVKTVGHHPEKTGFTAVRLDSKSLQTWEEQYFSQGGQMTIPMAAKYLGLKEVTVYFLTAQGVIPKERVDRMHKVLLIPREALENFKKHYIWGSALADYTNFPLRKSATTLISIGVQPISGPTVDGERQYIFLKEDVKKMIKRYETNDMENEADD